jgi:NADH-quinone oxidoreductase subunit E
MNIILEKTFEQFRGEPEELIPLLQSVQKEAGYLSDEAMEEIARFTHAPLSKVYGVATFYAQFRFKPKGDTHIMLCRGTACHVKGAPRIQEEIENHTGVKEGETSDDKQYSLENVACIGACSLAPVVMINDKVEANLTPDKVGKIFRDRKKKNEEGK